MNLGILNQEFNPVFRFIATFTGVAILAGCGSSGSGGTAVSSYNMAVKMTDASGCDYNNIVVTVGQVALNTRLNASKDDLDWTFVTLNPPVTIDLLQLQNGDTLSFANLNIPAGTYKSILLTLVPNSTSSSTYNDYVTLLDSPKQQIPLLFSPGFPNKISINFNKPVTISSDGTISNIVIDFDACHSVVTSTDTLGNILYFLKPKLMEINEDHSGGIVGTIITASSSSTAPQHLVVKAEIKGQDGNYYVVRQTQPHPDGTFKLYPLEYDDDSKGVYDVVVVSDNYGTLAIQDVIVPSHHDDVLLSSTTSADIGTIKFDTLTKPAVSWSTAGTFTGTITPRGADVRIRETVGGRTYQVRRTHSDLQTGIFTFPLSWGQTASEAYSTGTMTFTGDILTSAGSYTADTPSGDCDNDDRTVLEDQIFPFQITDGKKALTVIHDFVITPVNSSGVPLASLSSSLSGTVMAVNLPADDIEKVFLIALINGKFVIGLDEITLTVQTTAMKYTIDQLPVGAVVNVEAFIADFEHNSSETISVQDGSPVTLVNGTNIGPDFTFTE
ncbi:MAG: DUF4382 domain-containing protein [Nitrospiria bacterium]